MSALETVDVLGIRVDCLTKPLLLAQVERWAAEADPRTILYVNAHCLNVAAADPAHRQALQQADLVYSDGAGVVWASRLLGGCRLQKITGRDWIDDFCAYAAARGLRLYFLAGRPGVAVQAGSLLRARWPGLQVVGACDGYFTEKNEAAVLQDIAAAQPDVLLVGMNTPRQEKWITSQRPALPVPVCWAVGAVFDYVAGLEPPVPEWLNQLSLEWFWRLLMDPRGKWRRYLLGNPLFLYRLLQQRLAA